MKPIESGEAMFGTSPTMEEIRDAISRIEDVANSIWKAAKGAVQLVSARIVSFKSTSRALMMSAVDEQRDDLDVLNFLVFRSHFEMWQVIFVFQE
jgi:hypothetical protein